VEVDIAAFFISSRSRVLSMRLQGAERFMGAAQF
jgi:hypothetical protein